MNDVTKRFCELQIQHYHARQKAIRAAGHERAELWSQVSKLKAERDAAEAAFMSEYKKSQERSNPNEPGVRY